MLCFYYKTGPILTKGIGFAFLALGAVSGAHVRYKTTESPPPFNTLPVNILIVSVAGAFMLGIFVVMFSHWSLDSRYSLFAAVGFCVSLTTMSSFALESSGLMDNSRHASTAVHVLANAGLSIGARRAAKR